MGDIEAVPLGVSKRKLLRWSRTEINKPLLAGLPCQAASSRELVRASLDRHDVARWSYLSGHVAAKLAQSAADVEHALAWREMHLAERVCVEQPVHQAQAILLIRGGAVKVLVFIVAHGILTVLIRSNVPCQSNALPFNAKALRRKDAKRTRKGLD